MDVEKLVKISRDDIRGRSPERWKERWSDLIPVKTGGHVYKKNNNNKKKE
jgi:hypothetical protein